MGLADLASLIFAVGFVMMIAGILVLIFSAVRQCWREGRVEGGAVLIVGPLPLVLGTSTRVAKALLLLTITLTLVVLLMFVVLNYSLGVSR